ncbi:hypothetical protein PTTG_30542, partial [Puccinia triticina 1-1 BBBD Race 1]
MDPLTSSSATSNSASTLSSSSSPPKSSIDLDPSLNPNKPARVIIELQIEGRYFRALIDTGSEIDLISDRA